MVMYKKVNLSKAENGGNFYLNPVFHHSLLETSSFDRIVLYVELTQGSSLKFCAGEFSLSL